MGRVEVIGVEQMGKRARQVATQLWSLDKSVPRLIEIFDLGPDFSSINTIPQEFRQKAKAVAGRNSLDLFKLFSRITSKTKTVAAEEGGGSPYAPYVYDRRDASSPKILGVKIGRRGGLPRLASVTLAIPESNQSLILMVQNSRLPEALPDVIIRADSDQITVSRNQQEVPQEEKWLDEPFDRYLETVLTEAGNILPAAKVSSNS